ncbi:MAG: prepilin-type N-terminal cleavage/methylation domain-containing protein [Candidatus Omnitrophota bacterium]
MNKIKSPKIFQKCISSSTPWNSQTGFTLLEVMIASAILVIAIISILGVFYSGLGLNESSKNYITALNDARTALERIRDIQPFTNVNVTTVYPDNSVLPGFLNLDNEQVIVSYANTTADPLTITITVNWQERLRTRNLSLVTEMTER